MELLYNLKILSKIKHNGYTLPYLLRYL